MEKQSVIDSRLIERFEVHRDFTKLFLDAFVLLSHDHRILKFNPAFCQIVELRAIDLRKIIVFDDILKTSIPGNTDCAVDLLMNSQTPTRIDEVQATNLNTQKDLALIMSSYPYHDTDGTMLGACILMRDVTAETNLQSKYKHKSIESITDPLTGLYTRRYFESHIEKELKRCIENNETPALGVLLFDLDKFKTVNDTYGHQAGDYVLSETAQVLRTNSRRNDILGRYGGEELLVLISDATERGVTLAADKLRLAIQSHEYIFDGKRIPVTTSIGVTLIKLSTDTKEEAIKRSDECLYVAKDTGRNKVIVDFSTNGSKEAASDFLQKTT